MSKAILGLRSLGQIVLLLLLLVRLLSLSRPHWRRWLTWDAFLLPTLVAWVITQWILGLFYVPSRSMAPTLQVGDQILVNRLAFCGRAPNQGEVVVFHHRQHGDMVKRVVARGGDRIWAHAGRVYCNGQDVGPSSIEFPPRSVAPAHLFVLGDNRDNSVDSRFIGDIPTSHLVGSVWLRYWPLGRLGALEP